MQNFKVNLRKREVGDSFEMVLDPFMFNQDIGVKKYTLHRSMICAKCSS